MPSFETFVSLLTINGMILQVFHWIFETDQGWSQSWHYFHAHTRCGILPLVHVSQLYGSFNLCHQPIFHHREDMVAIYAWCQTERWNVCTLDFFRCWLLTFEEKYCAYGFLSSFIPYVLLSCVLFKHSQNYNFDCKCCSWISFHNILIYLLRKMVLNDCTVLPIFPLFSVLFSEQ